MSDFSKNISTFIGCGKEYREADKVIFGAPFDGTTSYRPGTRFASQYIRNESYGIETYSPYQDKDLEDIRVFDGGDLELPFGNAERALAMIEEYEAAVLADGKMPIMIGGEHLVTLGAVRAVLKKYPDLTVIQFDAHADLREDYLGERLSHACVLRRCHDLVGDGRIYQFGIRSGEREEFMFAKEHTVMCKFDFARLGVLCREIKTPVYLTVDLDVLDSSVFPGTGTPEAGGVGFNDLVTAIITVGGLTNVVAADINELSPHYDPGGTSTALACKTLRELLLAI
ncbi:MAG: agmatinase [Firmicutes bacterium]|nr:agmatinase [[Eubacterium] siraeum]MCM1487311.1 agmatinase [Bacillota bacterium]